MNFYCEIKVLPDPEAPETVLISNLFSKLHRILVRLKSINVGISFPKAGKTLGSVMRLHGNEADLKGLLETDWLKGLRDYCQVSDMKTVPSDCEYRCVKRLQKKSAYNKRKRSVAKGWLTEEEALRKIPDSTGYSLKQPFVQIKSNSTGQQVKLFIEHAEVRQAPISGEFNSYGLSKTATVPWF